MISIGFAPYSVTFEPIIDFLPIMLTLLVWKKPLIIKKANILLLFL